MPESGNVLSASPNDVSSTSSSDNDIAYGWNSIDTSKKRKEGEELFDIFLLPHKTDTYLCRQQDSDGNIIGNSFIDVAQQIASIQNQEDGKTFGTLTVTGDASVGGTLRVDKLSTLQSVDINSGTIDGVTIATSDITVGSGKTLDVSAGTLTLANDQISGDKVEGGTIASITISQLAGDMNCNNKAMTNVDIDSGAIDGVTIATSDITVGAKKTLDVSAGTLTLANDQISGDKVEGGTIASITISQLAGENAVMNCNNKAMTKRVDIDSGAIDGVTIATSDITVGAKKTLDVSAGTLTLANDQISGDKVEGGTIG